MRLISTLTHAKAGQFRETDAGVSGGEQLGRKCVNIPAKRMQALRGLLLCGASVISAGIIAGPALAADEGTETVVVTGIRASLGSSQQIKQNSDTFVDSITAEDIGALPDQSVTETLARVPGVSINRFAATVDPDHFSAEGSGVVIQGLTYTKSTLNGRDTFTANNGRALSFADVPPELLVGVDVYKNQSAEMVEGGIAGTVNLRTRVPFDAPGLLVAGSLAANYADFRHKWQPNISALVSNRWNTKIGEFGLLLEAVDSKLDVRSDGDQASNFACRTNLGDAITACPGGGMGVWFPRGAAFRRQDFNRDRRGAGAAAQWQSSDGTMVGTIQYLRSESRDQMDEHAIEIATDNVTSNGDSRPVTGTTFSFDSQGVFSKGVITGNTGWTDDTTFGGGGACGTSRDCDPRTPPTGLQSNNIKRNWDQHYVTNDLGGNFKWTPNETLAFNVDFDHVYSSVNIIDNGIWGSTDQNVSLDISGNYPVINMLPPSPDGNIANQPWCTTYGAPGQPPVANPSRCTTYLENGTAGFSDPAYNYWRSAMDHIERSRGTEDAARFDVDYHFNDGGWLQLARAGVRWASRVQTTRFSTYNWGVLSEQWGSGGPVWMSDPLPGVPQVGGYPAPAGSGPTSIPNVAPFAFTNFFRGAVPVPTGTQPRLFYTGNPAENYQAYSNFGLLVGDTWRPRYGTNPCSAAPGLVGAGGFQPQNWVPLAMRCGAIPGTPFLPGEINPVSEISEEAYFMLKFGHEVFDGHTLSGNIGVRYFNVSHRSSGTVAFNSVKLPTDADCNPPSPPPGFIPQSFCGLSDADKATYRQFLAGAGTTQQQHFTYDYFLPSLNLRFDLNDEMLLRFAASQAVSLPDVGFTRFFLTLSQLPDLPPTTPGGIPGFGGWAATAGNPFLKPIRSNMFDLSYEWYFAKVGSLTAAVFWKELKGVITNGTRLTPFTNNGATVPIELTAPFNATKDGTAYGFEIAYQRFFDFLPDPFDGLGVNVNYAYINSKGVPQNTLSNTDPNVAAGNIANVDTSKLPLQGLSNHNINAELIYEKGPFSARIAYNWRSKFLLTPRDVIVPFAPIMNAADGQLDGSFFYNITDQLKAGVEAVNLLNDVVETDQVLAVTPHLLTAPRSFFVTDRRVTFTLRFQY
jgi:TonB-dependent receptor